MKESQWKSRCENSMPRADLLRKLFTFYVSHDDDGFRRIADELIAEARQDMEGIYKFQRRSKSTVQHDVFSWQVHKDSYSGGDYTLAVVARRNWDSTAVTQRFAVAVTVEVDDPKVEISSRIVQRVRELARVRVPQRVGVR
jgi:hypothetical protein